MRHTASADLGVPESINPMPCVAHIAPPALVGFAMTAAIALTVVALAWLSLSAAFTLGFHLGRRWPPRVRVDELRK